MHPRIENPRPCKVGCASFYDSSVFELDVRNVELDSQTTSGLFQKLAFELNFDEPTGVALGAPPFLQASW